MLLKDLFRAEVDARKAASDLVIPELRKRDASWVVEGDIEELDDDLANSFVVTKTGLSFLYEPYQMGSYAEGSYIVKVPFGAFGEKLDREGPLKRLLAAE